MKEKIIDILKKRSSRHFEGDGIYSQIEYLPEISFEDCADEILKIAEFEALCNPNLYEMSANEHFENQAENKDKLIDACLALLYILKNGFHLSNPNQYFGMKCELEVEIEKLKKELGL